MGTVRPLWGRGRAAGTVAAMEVPLDGPGGVYARFVGGGDASFTTARHGDAFWLVRPPSTGIGNLFVSSGAAIVREARADLGITSGPVAWSAALFNAAADRAEAAHYAVDLPSMRAGDPVPVEWMRVLLWAVYSSGQGGTVQVDLPRLVELPRLGDAVTGDDPTPTMVAPGFDPTRVSPDPWATPGTSFRVSEGAGAGARRRSSGGLLLAALALVAVVMGGKR